MKPLILITNDDGIDSPGILAAAKAVKRLGDLLVVAPMYQQTGMGRSFPRSKEQGIIKKRKLNLGDEIITGYGVIGSPAHAVVHGIFEIADRLPDLCISGINYGENLGTVITCSGTVGAVLEASCHGVPGIAVSRQADIKTHRSADYAELNWGKEIIVTSQWAEKVLHQGMPKNAEMININIPYQIESDVPYRITRQSRQNYFEFVKPKNRDFGKAYEMVWKVKYDSEEEGPDTDIHAVCVEKTVSVTPLSWDMSRCYFI